MNRTAHQLDHLEDSGRSIPSKEPEVISCLKMHIIYISQLGKLYSGKNLIDHGILALNDLTQSLANELGLKRRNWMETSWILHIPTTSNKWAVYVAYGSTFLQPQWNPICFLTTLSKSIRPRGSLPARRSQWSMTSLSGSLSGSSLHCRDIKQKPWHRLTSPLSVTQQTSLVYLNIKNVAKLGNHQFGVVFELIWELLYVDTACHFACCIGYTVVHYCDFLWKEIIRNSYVCWSMYANQIRTPTPKLETFVDCACFGFPIHPCWGFPKATLDLKLATVPRTSVDHNATTHMGQWCCWLSSWLRKVGWS